MLSQDAKPQTEEPVIKDSILVNLEDSEPEEEVGTVPEVAGSGLPSLEEAIEKDAAREKNSGEGLAR